MKTIKVFTVIGLLGLLTTFSFSFTWSQMAGENEWTKMAEIDDVVAYAIESKCEKDDVYLFKFENSSDKVVTVNYTLAAKLDPTFPPITKQLRLQPKESVSGNCDTMWEMTLPNGNPKDGDLKNRLSVTMSINK